MVYSCNQCGYEYNSDIGDIECGIEAGIEFDDLPDDWVCPLCGASKEEFEEKEDIVRDYE